MTHTGTAAGFSITVYDRHVYGVCAVSAVWKEGSVTVWKERYRNPQHNFKKSIFHSLNEEYEIVELTQYMILDICIQEDGQSHAEHLCGIYNKVKAFIETDTEKKNKTVHLRRFLYFIL